MSSTAFVPEKGVDPIALRAIERHQLANEGTRFVTTDILSTSPTRGIQVFNESDGLFYYFNGSLWVVQPGQMLRRAGTTNPAILNLTSDSPLTADAGHDVASIGAIAVPNLGFGRLVLEASCDSFKYTTDPGSDAIITLQICDDADVELAAASSSFKTGTTTLRASGVTVRRIANNVTFPAGTHTLKLRVTSTVTTQPYGTHATATRFTTFSAMVV